MENAIIPIGKAHEPNEGARNPMDTNTSQSPERQSRKHITFADDTCTEKSTSQSQASYKEVLSQPAAGLSHRQKLLWLQKRRISGLWVQCDDCQRWRFLPNALDSHELPNKWFCRMNPDSMNADCSVPETPIRLRDEEDLIHSLYSAGSLVWARMPGWPWWPAMVDDCPDTEQYYWLDGFSDIPTHYNVVFFDSSEVTRGWIAPDNINPYNSNQKNISKNLQKKYKIRLVSAMKQADDASKLPLSERLEKYSFIAKYKGKIGSPKKITKADLIRHQKKMKRQFNIEFPIETSDSDAEDEPLPPLTPRKNRNMIILGTPKRGIKKSVQDNMHVETAVNIVENGTLSEDQINNTPVCPSRLERPRKLIQDSMNVSESSDVLQDKTETGPLFKRPNSMVVQVGSTVDTPGSPSTESYDNDTSKTYVPDIKQTLESTDNETEMETQEFETRAVTPSSDDFDF